MKEYIKILMRKPNYSFEYTAIEHFALVEKWIEKDKISEVFKPIKSSSILTTGYSIEIEKKTKGILWWKKDYEEEVKKERKEKIPHYILAIKLRGHEVRNDCESYFEIFFPDTEQGRYNLNTYLDYLKKELNLKDFDLLGYTK